MKQADADRTCQALQDALGGTARWERVSRGRYRIEVVTPAFDGQSHRKRQNRVWEVVDQTLDRETALDITMIVPFAPADFDAERQLRELEAALER